MCTTRALPRAVAASARMSALRVALVGAGGVAQRHARVLAGFEDVELVAVADVDPARAAAVAGPLGAAALGSVDEVLERSRPDAVYVCVPPFAHGEIEGAVLAAGLPMFVEKPLAADLATAERLAAAVADAGVITATGYHWRHLDTLAHLREQVGAASPAVSAAARWVGKVAPVGWWAQRSGSGGQVVEQATHVVDVLRVLMGEVVSVQALAARAGVAGPVGDAAVIDDAVVALLRFASGAVATLEVSCVADRLVHAGVSVSAAGPAGGPAWVLEEERLTRVAGGEPEVRVPAVDARVAVDRAFVDAVRAGDPSLVAVDVAEALRTHRVACAVVESAATGRAVVLDGDRGPGAVDVAGAADGVIPLPAGGAPAPASR